MRLDGDGILASDVPDPKDRQAPPSGSLSGEGQRPGLEI